MNPLDLIDERLTFRGETHEYHYFGRPLSSVTTLVHRFVPEFNEYLHSERVARRKRVSQDEILAEWRRKADRATALGTLAHAEAERCVWQIWDRGYFEPDLRLAEVPYGDETFKHCRGVWAYLSYASWLPYSRGLLPELRIAHPDWALAGTIDLWHCDAQGQVTLLDWKTSKEITPFGWDNMLPPLDDLSDGNYWTYALQLNTYALILKEQYGVPVDRLLLVHLGRAGSFTEIEMPWLEDHVWRMLETAKCLSHV